MMAVTFADEEADTIEIGSAPAARWSGRCTVCGTELDDRRKSKCDNCKGSTTAKRATKARTGRRGAGVTAEVEKGATSVLGKGIMFLTLIWAWYSLRSYKIPDPNGDLADTLSMNDDESVLVARALTRFIAKNGGAQGARALSAISDAEDLIDAGIAIWDWRSRVNNVMEQLTKGRLPEPEVSNNGNQGQAGGDRSEGQGYIGPGTLADYSVV